MIKSSLMHSFKNTLFLLRLLLKQIFKEMDPRTMTFKEKTNLEAFKIPNREPKIIKRKLIKNLVYLALFGLLIFPLQAGVQNYGGKEESAPPSTQSNLWVRKAEDFLNAIRYLKTTFIQHNPDGSQSEGIFYLSRPDKMRIEYKSPQQLIILSDGQYLYQYDPLLDESSKADLELTPAAILLNEKINFSGAIQVLEVNEEDNNVYIQISKVGGEDLGTFTFRFQKAPFDLKGWTVLDQQGQIITVELNDRKERPKALDYSLFRFHRKKD